MAYSRDERRFLLKEMALMNYTRQKMEPEFS